MLPSLTGQTDTSLLELDASLLSQTSPVNEMSLEDELTAISGGKSGKEQVDEKIENISGTFLLLIRIA